ncbi:hypothetical protein CHS0354_043011 [Potamilus streckersoni]|uniref:Uncharacterized protein n=1 Tax=Potamilus streckersoni TaxID=2493646 RepID=A0AAE0W5U6_9BIVA|nr:hypothetical protein CHS0354_043011 [Potamilus streckersoni]
MFNMKSTSSLSPPCITDSESPFYSTKQTAKCEGGIGGIIMEAKPHRLLSQHDDLPEYKPSRQLSYKRRIQPEKLMPENIVVDNHATILLDHILEADLSMLLKSMTSDITTVTTDALNDPSFPPYIHPMTITSRALANTAGISEHHGKLHFSSLHFPTNVSDIIKSESLDPTISINVFEWDYALYPMHTVNLMLLIAAEKKHKLGLKDLSRMAYRKSSHNTFKRTRAYRLKKQNSLTRILNNSAFSKTLEGHALIYGSACRARLYDVAPDRVYQSIKYLTGTVTDCVDSALTVSSLTGDVECLALITAIMVAPISVGPRGPLKCCSVPHHPTHRKTKMHDETWILAEAEAKRLSLALNDGSFSEEELRFILDVRNKCKLFKT